MATTVYDGLGSGLRRSMVKPTAIGLSETEHLQRGSNHARTGSAAYDQTFRTKARADQRYYRTAG